GQEINDLYPDREKTVFSDAVLSLKNFHLNNKSKVSLKLNKGEILGLFGLVGSGINTLAERIFGIKTGKGSIEIEGKQTIIKNPKNAMSSGIAYLPSDRHQKGIVKELPINQNITL